MTDAGVDRSEVSHLFVGNFLGSILLGQQLLGPIIANQLGLTNAEAIATEGACSSSAIGVHLGVELVAAGVARKVLVVGVEKMTGLDADRVTGALMSATDLAHEGDVGLTFAAFWALSMRRHMHEFGTRREQISLATVKNRRHGVKNTYSQFRKAITLEEALDSRLISDPLRLYDCCPATDGAAAVLLGPASSVGDRAVDVLASVQVTGRSRITDYDSLTHCPATEEAARRAYAAAGIEASDLDLVELHDCFSMAELVDSEDLGLIPKGQGGIAMDEAWTDFGGRVVVNPSGGLLSKGHPVGATGCGQIFEVVRQLRGEHPNQVEGAQLGMTHNAGGTQALVNIHVLAAR
jgi:acetyl-CoA C-acetyltransferase